MSPTFRERQSCFWSRKRGRDTEKRSEENKGCDDSRILEDTRAHIIIVFPSCVLHWGTRRENRSKRQREERRKRERKGENGSGRTTLTTTATTKREGESRGNGGEQARGFWVGGKERGKGDKYRPGNWVTLTEGIAFAARSPPFPSGHPPALKPPLISRFDTSTMFDDADVSLCCRSLDRRPPFSYLHYVTLYITLSCLS